MNPPSHSGPKRRRRWKRIVLRLGLLFGTTGVLFVWLVGPWPAYRDEARTNHVIEKASGHIAAAPFSKPSRGPLHAGWATGDLTPNDPLPMFGYGVRAGAASQGVHDPIRVKAIALDNQDQQLLIFAADLLLISDDLTEPVRAAFLESHGLQPWQIFFSATHTHSAPNPWRWWPAAGFAGAAVDSAWLTASVRTFVKTGGRALDDLAPARLDFQAVEAPDLIRNRVWKDEVDSYLRWLTVERDDGAQAILAGFGAHATVLGPDNLQISGDYPGFFQERLEEDESVTALFMATAVGSGGPRVPGLESEVDSDEVHPDFAPARAMGHALATRLLQDQQPVQEEFRQEVVMGSIGMQLPTPPYQARVHPGWRLSPMLFRLTGLPRTAWFQVLRIDDLYLVGLSVELSGEVALQFDPETVWFSSFSGDYRGYVIPDRRYAETFDGDFPYETALVNWLGPHAEMWTTTLTYALLQRLKDPAGDHPD